MQNAKIFRNAAISQLIGKLMSADGSTPVASAKRAISFIVLRSDPDPAARGFVNLAPKSLGGRAALFRSAAGATVKTQLVIGKSGLVKESRNLGLVAFRASLDLFYDFVSHDVHSPNSLVNRLVRLGQRKRAVSSRLILPLFPTS